MLSLIHISQNVELTPEMEEEPDANRPYDQMIHDERMNIINRLVNELQEAVGQEQLSEPAGAVGAGQRGLDCLLYTSRCV